VPRVTVITATYNWATVLPFSIGSALDQTFTDFELLVIGDGCTDESADVVTRIDDPRVRWHNLAVNSGHQSGPNNEGIEHAAGDVIAYLGHDDLWLPHHLEVLVDAIDHGARLAHATTLGVRPNHRPLPFPLPGWSYHPGRWLPPTAVAHDRTVAQSVGGWHSPRDTGTLDPEAELWQRITDASKPPVWVHRLTNIKLSAGERAGVYRDRPHHEQAVWLTRIREADDAERFLQRYLREPQARVEQIVKAARTNLAIRTRLRTLRLLPPERETAEERRIKQRRLKGLDD
jgi:glycosyltransferase involved in cell wall biosynthesis